MTVPLSRVPQCRKRRVMVIVLDGVSFVLANTFLWRMPNVRWFFHNFRRRLMYIDDVPLTPVVLNTMFTGKNSSVHGVLGFRHVDKPGELIGRPKIPHIWSLALARGRQVKIINVPVTIPPVWINASSEPLDWVDCWLPPCLLYTSPSPRD